jgi:hypothetical protein
MQVDLTRAQYDAIPRLLSSFERASSISGITIGQLNDDIFDSKAWSFVRVEFRSGHGNRRYDLDMDGNSEHVGPDGHSTISREARR